MISLVGRHPEEPKAFKDAVASLAGGSGTTKKSTASAKGKGSHPAIWRERAFKSLFALAQFHKCAYCEMPLTATYHGDVEHYRPVAAVEHLTRGDRNDLASEPRRKVLSREKGYEWLKYTWRNYLLACSKCNAVWKKNQFPIKGRRAARLEELTQEQPLLLNPFDADPTGHFEYEDMLGAVLPRTKAGEATITVCGLDRASLDSQRLIKAQKLKRRFDEYEYALMLANEVATRNALRAILDECRDASAHAGMARFLTRKRTSLSYDELLKLDRLGEL
jgi:hypothetical protein